MIAPRARLSDGGHRAHGGRQFFFRLVQRIDATFASDGIEYASRSPPDRLPRPAPAIKLPQTGQRPRGPFPLGQSRGFSSICAAFVATCSRLTLGPAGRHPGCGRLNIPQITERRMRCPHRQIAKQRMAKEIRGTKEGGHRFRTRSTGCRPDRSASKNLTDHFKGPQEDIHSAVGLPGPLLVAARSPLDYVRNQDEGPIRPGISQLRHRR